MPEEYAPPVVVVVVARDPGPHLEECLGSLGRQDYENLDVLVVDDASIADLTGRIAAVLPRAIVRRRPAPGGFAACANEALEGIEGATFFLFCHDDVALAPDGVRNLVAEAFRSNAGIVGPKLVAWDDPQRLLHVGLAVNRFGAPDARVDAGELDQSQHDEVREVFAVPAGCQLVRVDLFAALGGMDEDMERLGEDVDLCWRVHVAGARVVVAPQAAARHLEASKVGERTLLPTAADRRDELRAVLKNYGVVRRAFTLLLLVLGSIAGTVTSSLGGRGATRVRTSRRWRWNLAHRSSLLVARSRVRESRSAPDSEVVARMASRRRHRRRRSAATELRTHGGSEPSGATPARLEMGRLARRRSDEDTDRPARRVVAGSILGLVLFLGVRGALLGHLPLVGDLVPMPTGSHLLGEYFAGRSDPGWRPAQVAPPAYAVVGLVAIVLGNSSALALKVVLLAGIAVGALGAARLVSDFGSTRARITAALALAASPVVWNALAHGDIQASVALASLPFIFRRLAIASRLRPYAPAHTGRAGPGGLASFAADAAPLGLVLALAVSLAPAVLIDTAVVALAIAVASLVVGDSGGALRCAAVATVSSVVAFACTLPWSLTWFEGARWSLFAGAVGPVGSAWRPAALLRGAAGPVGRSWIAWGLVAAAAFVLVGSSGSRLRWAARWWAVIAASVAIAWVGGEGWLGAGGGDTLVLLAPLAVGVAACCGLGVGAFEGDLARYRFGWRQALLLGAAGCFVGGLLPGAEAALNGRAGLPPSGFDQILGWMGAAGGSTTAPASRALWIGDPRALPGRPLQLAPGLAAFVTASGLPGATVAWPQPNPGPGASVAAALESAQAGRTVQLGALLAPYGIRYLVVPSAAAPEIIGQQSPPLAPPPLSLVQALQAQSDFRELPVEAAIAVFQNVAWVTGDGQGTVKRPGATSSPGLRGAGLAVGLLVVAACTGEGFLRRRRLRRLRPAGWRGGTPLGAPQGPLPGPSQGPLPGPLPGPSQGLQPGPSQDVPAGRYNPAPAGGRVGPSAVPAPDRIPTERPTADESAETFGATGSPDEPEAPVLQGAD
jgi:GT2 family glycosyltransferase